MYNPPRFKSDNVDEAFGLIYDNPFATVIAMATGVPVISHLPLTSKRSYNQIELIGHMARANPQWRFLEASPVQVIFFGPHTYVTPSWYVDKDVPTWDYSVVHATGTVQLIEDTEGIMACLRDLTEHAEGKWPSGWQFFVPDDLAGDRLSKNIVGFKITVQSINFKKKGSQSRTPADRAGVMKGLATRTDSDSQAILADMLKTYKPTGELK